MFHPLKLELHMVVSCLLISGLLQEQQVFLPLSHLSNPSICFMIAALTGLRWGLKAILTCTFLMAKDVGYL